MNSTPVKSSLFILCALFLQATAQADQDPVEADTTYQSGKQTLSHYVHEFIKPVPAEPYWYVQGSVYTRHFNPKSEHNNHQKLIGLERHTENSYLMGGATFKHSYGQRSYYGYVGKRFDFAGTPFYGKVTGGLLYGYKGEYRDKIPFNRFKIAPAIIPSLGVKYHRLGAEIVLLGTAATMINIGFEL
ncbi:MAG: sn-glycerol-3-phosphate transporter [Pseudomonas sp.]|nr:sn-glycerol-3-phosphate transporter [Pseudomonas sp.]